MPAVTGQDGTPRPSPVSADALYGTSRTAAERVKGNVFPENGREEGVCPIRTAAEGEASLQTAGEAPNGTSPVTSCGEPRSFPGADIFQRPFELRVYAAAHLSLDLGGLKHLDMGDDAYALVYLAPGIFHHGRRTVYAHY